MNKRKYLIANLSKTSFVDIDQIVSAHLLDNNGIIGVPNFSISVTCTNNIKITLASYEYSNDNKEKVEAFAMDQLSELLLLMALPEEYRISKYSEETEKGVIQKVCLTPEKLCEDIDNYEAKSVYRELEYRELNF